MGEDITRLIRPEPPSIGDTRTQNEEELRDAIEKIGKHLQDLALYDNKVNDVISSDFIVRGSQVTDLTIDQLLEANHIIAQLIQIGGNEEGGNFIIGGSVNPESLRVLDDSRERVILGKLGAEYGIWIRDEDGNLILSASGLGLEVVSSANLQLNEVSIALARIIDLNAERITAGIFDPDRLPEGARPDNIDQAIADAIAAINVPEGFDPDTYDWSTLGALIPFNKISGVQITEGMIAASVIIGNIVAASAGAFGLLAARIARVVELDADRITTGELVASRITGDVKNATALWKSEDGHTLSVRDTSENEARNVEHTIQIPADLDSSYFAYEIYTSEGVFVVVNPNSTYRSIWEKQWRFSAPTPTYNIYNLNVKKNQRAFSFQLARAASGRSRFNLILYALIGVTAPGAGNSATASQTFYRRGAMTPSVPTAITGTPSGWSTVILQPTSTDNVYSIVRTQTLTNGAVSSARYGVITRIADAGSGMTIATQTFYIIAETRPSAPTGNTGTPSGWSTTDPGPQARYSVWHVTRIQTLQNGVVISAVWEAVVHDAAPTNLPDITDYDFNISLDFARVSRSTQTTRSGWQVWAYEWDNIDRSGTFLSTISSSDAGGNSVFFRKDTEGDLVPATTVWTDSTMWNSGFLSLTNFSGPHIEASSGRLILYDRANLPDNIPDQITSGTLEIGINEP